MLKRTFFTLAAAAGMAVSASAQNIVPVNDNVATSDDEIVITEVLKPYTFSIGPKVGVGLSMATEPEGIGLNMSSGIGYNAGAAFNLRFGRPAGRPLGAERFGVQLETLYSVRTLKNDVEDITLNCFEVPVLFQWYFIPNLALEVGPTFTGAFSTSPESFKYKESSYQLDKVKAYDVMLSVGVNWKFKNGLAVNLRYNLGNSNIAENFKTKTSTASLGISWLFNVIK